MLSSVQNFNHVRIERQLEKMIGHDFSTMLILLDPHCNSQFRALASDFSLVEVENSSSSSVYNTERSKNVLSSQNDNYEQSSA